MREFLLELYLAHGERAFVPHTRGGLFAEARWNMEFIDHAGWVENSTNETSKYKLSPKAFALIRNDS